MVCANVSADYGCPLSSGLSVKAKSNFLLCKRHIVNDEVVLRPNPPFAAIFLLKMSITYVVYILQFLTTMNLRKRVALLLYLTLNSRLKGPEKKLKA